MPRGTAIKIARVGKDLGVATIAGRRRCAQFVRGRNSGTYSRVKRIRMLARLVHRAHKLYNIGALPQATYEYEAYGFDLSSMMQMRALAQ